MPIRRTDIKHYQIWHVFHSVRKQEGVFFDQKVSIDVMLQFFYHFRSPAKQFSKLEEIACPGRPSMDISVRPWQDLAKILEKS